MITLYRVKSGSCDTQLERTQVFEWLARRLLVHSDLVFENGGWCTLLDSSEFGEAAQRSLARQLWRQQVAQSA